MHKLMWVYTVEGVHLLPLFIKYPSLVNNIQDATALCPYCGIQSEFGVANPLGALGEPFQSRGF
jgi:hypothetical protein